MSKFSDYFNSLKQDGSTLQEQSKVSVSEIVQHISERWRLIIPKTNAEKNENPTFISIVNLLTKINLPFDIDIKPQSILAIGRYRGIIIAICHHNVFTKDKLRIISFIPNSLLGNSKITKLEKPDETIEDTSTLVYRYGIETTHLEDRPILFKYIDSYSQQMFLSLADKLAIDDAFYLNKNLVLFDITKNIELEEADVLMSIMCNFMERLKKQ